ncbi:MAG: 50S ribosomal protein L25 [Chloroflexota bacterium]|nr:50S ribosomal protein L25 [Chloroflexota bacterium]
MANKIRLAAKLRDGKEKAKALRRQEIIPGVLYGRDFDALSIKFDSQLINQVIRTAGTSRLISLDIEGDGDSHTTLIRDIQRDPVSSDVLHVDLYRVVEGQTITNLVPIVTYGRSPVLDMGATIVQVLDDVEVECVPEDMPAAIRVDLATLEHIHDHVAVADLVVPDGVEILTAPETEVIQVIAQRSEEEVEETLTAAAPVVPEIGLEIEEEVEEEIPEGEEVEEGEEGEEAEEEERPDMMRGTFYD